MEREAVVWNCSCVDALKRTVVHRRVPRDRVSGSLSVPTRNGSMQNRSKVSCKRSLIQRMKDNRGGRWAINSFGFTIERKAETEAAP